MSGRLITVEGGEGAGKSTQIKHLATSLELAGRDVRTTREPGGSPGAEAIRALLVSGETDRWDPVSETLLILAARRDHVERVIKPALAAGEWVLCDRFADSTAAYQGAGHGLGRDWVREIGRLTLGDFTPDLTLILDIPVGDGLARAGKRGGDDRFERMGTGFHDRLRRAFLDIAAEEPVRCAVIDATAEEYVVADAVRKLVADRLPDSGLSAAGGVDG
ncbi:dTMP kinase [Marivibrio halodurans]|uniref:Thymidylate kinase n=1 Tax=Marivibrio halodurans TaxID=2039722 RepID=A0A8J7V103_9PROT|nr:dTMP kinase [Marivibrio halodurans]MBP5855596.1 dTMP kinase [Marivibrio halodurans]